jgi:hypothetical protein
MQKSEKIRHRNKRAEQEEEDKKKNAAFIVGTQKKPKHQRLSNLVWRLYWLNLNVRDICRVVGMVYHVD